MISAYQSDFDVARSAGLSVAGLNRLRSLLAERGANAWAVGDVLTAVYGPPGPGVHDGSRDRLERVGEILGCSGSWLAACRATSAAFPPRERRPSVAWSVHRRLSAHPARHRVLDRFVAECSRRGVTPSLKVLTDWLDAIDGAPRRGRPRADPVAAVYTAALRLDPGDLARLVTMLAAATRAAA